MVISDSLGRFQTHLTWPALALLVVASLGSRSLLAASPACNQHTAIERGTELTVRQADTSAVDRILVELNQDVTLHETPATLADPAVEGEKAASRRPRCASPKTRNCCSRTKRACRRRWRSASRNRAPSM